MSGGAVQSKEVGQKFHLCTPPTTNSLLLLLRIQIRSLSKKPHSNLLAKRSSLHTVSSFYHFLYLQTHQDERFEGREKIDDDLDLGEDIKVEAEAPVPSPTLMASIICKPNAATIQKTDVQYNLVRKKLNVIKILDCNCPGLFVCKSQVTFYNPTAQVSHLSIFQHCRG